MLRVLSLVTLLTACQHQSTAINIGNPAPEWGQEKVLAGCVYDPDDDECRCLEIVGQKVSQKTFQGKCPGECG